MAEASMVRFDYKELAGILVRERGLREGYWSIYLRFGINAANVGINNAMPVPTALVPVIEIGIQREADDDPGPMAVNAAEVNPGPKAAKKGAGKQREK